jgi:hypothetical protein
VHLGGGQFGRWNRVGWVCVLINMSEKTFWQTIETTGDQLLKTVKDLIEAGNVRRIRIKQKGHVVAEFPLTIGVVGAVFAPVLAAIGALAAVITECSIEVERVEKT